MIRNRHVIAVASGGLDSTTLAYWLRARHESQLTLLSVDYGQRHRRELAFVERTARALECDSLRLEIPGLSALMQGSALTDLSVGVPSGHYTDSSMRSTVVPNRNALLLDLAVALAVSSGADTVAFGAHAGDHPIYPDCRPAFLVSYAETVALANEGFLAPDFKVIAPFLTSTKAEIVRLGAGLGVPFEATWSCYRGDERHCGQCGTCTERREAFQQAGVPDPTAYQDTPQRM